MALRTQVRWDSAPYKRGTEVRLYSRNRLPQDLPAVASAIARLPVDALILDGEVTWEAPRGYHVFDVLWWEKTPVTALPLEQRRALLEELPLQAPLRRVELLENPKPWERARRENWEGVMAKRRGSPYEHRRSKHWLKMKCEVAQAFVVGGFTDPRGARVGLGALLVGYYDTGEFVFAGKVGTGFDTTLLLDVRRRLDAIEVPEPPFRQATGLPRLRAHWLRQSGSGLRRRLSAYIYELGDWHAVAASAGRRSPTEGLAPRAHRRTTIALNGFRDRYRQQTYKTPRLRDRSSLSDDERTR